MKAVVPVVVGFFGTIPAWLASYMALHDVSLLVEMVQKPAILGTAQTLSKGLETESTPV